MLADFKNQDEEGRIAALNRLEVLDTGREAPFDKIVTLIQQIFEVPMCAVSLVDRHRQWFKAVCGIDVNETSRSVSFCTHAIQNSKPFLVPNALEDFRFAENPLVTGAPFIRSYAGIPLTTPDGYNVGTLCAIDIKPRQFSQNEIEVLENFGRVVVDELELRQIASRDLMTGALSRRAWMERANSEISRAKRYHHPLSLAILDIDQFKSINDAFGHPAGDKVIKTLADLCILIKRESDIFGRIGGEEFALIMPETEAEAAKNLLERIRRRFRLYPIDVGTCINSSVSAGIAGLTAFDSGLDDLFARADKALYAAKDRGRDRTVVDLLSAHDKNTSRPSESKIA